MDIVLGVVLVIVVLFLILEVRIKKPNEIVLFEKSGMARQRGGKYYFRHFNMAIPNLTHSTILNVDSEAKGKIGIKVKIALTVAASLKNISQLVRAGGWSVDAVKNASKELNLIIQAEISKITESKDIEEVTSEYIYSNLGKTANSIDKLLGLDIISLSVQSVEPSDEEITEALRQREAAIIKEKTEAINQKSRVTASFTKLKADEDILAYEHNLELKKIDLKNLEFDKNSQLAEKKLHEELKRNRMKLELEKEEVKLLKDNPELLMLTPQIARLAEASQNLKNARTIVSLGTGEQEQGSQILGVLHSFLTKLVEGNIPKNK